MINQLRYALFATAMAGCTSPANAAVCAPAKLTHIVVENVTPGVAAGSFAAQPKSFYRLGSNKVRIEEAPDPTNGIHGVLVVAEPDVWLANLYTHTGTHAVDQGPTFFAKVPVFGIADISPKLLKLEFGCEADYIAANALKPARIERVGDAQLEVYRIENSDDAVEVLETKGTHTPAFARYYRQGQLFMALRYDLYSVGIANDSTLFTPPANIHYVEKGSP